MGSNFILNANIFRDELISGPRQFFLDAQKELARVERHGAKCSFALIRPNLNFSELNDDYIKSLYFFIKEQLRQCDSLYIFDRETFAAILPETHEAGGEMASARIKKNISRAYANSKQPLSVSVGIVSVWPGRCPNVTNLIEELKEDLERDQKCQFLPQPHEARYKKVCVIAEKDLQQKLTKALSSKTFKILDKKNIEDAEIVVIQENFCRKRDIDIEFLQNNRGLEYTANIKTHTDSISIISKNPMDPIKFIITLCLLDDAGCNREPDLCKKKYEDILSAIGSSTHQLNQPLQIMMGKIELLLLDLSLGEDVSKVQIQEALKQLKKQVHYASEINAKINRLTKF